MQARSFLLAACGLGAIMLVSALTGLGPAQLYSPAARAEQADDAELLRELAERLLGLPPPWLGASIPPVQLLVGRLPEGLPPLPSVPSGGRLLGSMVRANDNSGTSFATTVLLEVPGERAEEVEALYRHAFREQAWTAPQSGRGFTGGVLTPPLPTNVFCYTDQWVAVLQVSPVVVGVHEVRLSVGTAPSPCTPPVLRPEPPSPTASTTIARLSGGMPPPQLAQEPEGYALLHELAERLLENSYGSPGPSPPTVRLLPGNVPPDLPLTVLVPPGGRLIGSMVQGPSGMQPGSTVVLVDSPGEPTEATSFYGRAFEEQGWVLQPSSTPPGGFQAVETNASAFCQPAGPVRATVIVTPRTGGRGDTRVILREGPGPCGTVPAPFPPGASLVPRLHGRDGMRLQPVGAVMSGPNHWGSASIAFTAESPGSLETFFAQQLQAAGWVRRAGRADGSLAWSQWQIPTASDWLGLLLVYEGPGEHQRTFFVQVERSPQ